MRNYLNKLFLFSALLLFAGPARAGRYLWPMQGSRNLSSSFFEFRDGHIHAGIDIRSYGQLGLSCYAVSDGYVERVKVNPYGYGRALYLRLADGNTAVYAHLYGFSAEIDSLVYFRRSARRSSWCDIHLPAGAYRFSAGEVLAYSGTSGTKAPHLHFELRDNRGRPFNPLLEAYSVPDGIPPEIHALEVTPLSPGSMTGEIFRPAEYLFATEQEGIHTIADTLHLSGSAGFGLSAWDRQNAGIYRLEPFSIDITIDGDTLYALENRSFSYFQSGDIRFEYNDYDDGWKRRYRNLYRKRGNTLPDRLGPGTVHGDNNPSSTGLVLDRTVHRADITVRDISGNTARAAFYFRIHQFPEVTNIRKLVNSSEIIIASSDPDGGDVKQMLYESTDGGENWRRLQLESIGAYGRFAVTDSEGAVYRYTIIDDEGMEVSGTYAPPSERSGIDMAFSDCSLFPAEGSVIIDIRTDRILQAPPTVEIYPAVKPDQIVQVGDKSYYARFSDSSLTEGENLVHITGTDHRGYGLEDFHAVQIGFLSSGKMSEWQAGDSAAVRIASDSVTGRAPIIISPAEAAVDSTRTVVIPPFRLRYQEDRFIDPVRILSEAGERVGLYRLDGGGSSWNFVGQSGTDNGIAAGKSGVYAFFRDGLPPKIGEVRIVEKPSGSGFFREYSYSVPVEDSGSGIDPYSAETLWNGNWILCRWDDIRGCLEIPVPDSIESGRVSLKVAISDKIGNRSVESFSFVIE